MADAAIHILQILGVFVCAHHFWPKGVTYGEQEEWEKNYRKKHHHASSKGQRERHQQRERDCARGDTSGSSRSGHGYARVSPYREDEDSYREGPRDRERSRRDYDYYDEQPRYERRASSRY